MKPLFWAIAGIVTYVYFGYPMLLLAVRLLRGPKEPKRAPVQPSVTLMISAFNEQDVIREKLTNCLELGYPKDKLQVIVISDASDDKTDDIVREFSDRGVQLARMPARAGKTVGLNEAIKCATGEIVVFSDANAMYEPEALDSLVRNFADSNVGAAIGESTYLAPEAASERSEGLYWRYETGIKKLESQVGSVVGGDGAIYAIRKELYVAMPPDALSDFVNPLQVVRAGMRCIYEPAARSYERAADSFRKEFRRKVRIVNRAWRATWRMRGLLNPVRYGFFAVQLASHKLLRWLMPFALISLLGLNAGMLGEGRIYELAMVAQVSFFLLALAGWGFIGSKRMPAILSAPFYFTLVNVASAVGILDALRGRTYTTWTTARAAERVSGPS